MRSMGAWVGQLAMAGVCLSWMGCGGGDVPDPDSDSRAASNEPSRPSPRASAEPAEKAEPEPLASNTAPNTDAAKTEPGDSEKAAPSSPNTDATPKADSSGTDEMLRMPGGSAPSTPGSPPAGSPATPPPPSARPGEPGPGPGGSAVPPPAAAAPGGGGAMAPGTIPGPGNNRGRERGPGGAPGEPGGPGTPPPGGGAADEGGRGGRLGGGGFGLPAGAGGPGAMGGGGASAPANYHYPDTTVTAFLDALKARNKDRLADATAKRASTEAVVKHQKIFTEILDGSISDDDLDEIAKSFDGFKVISTLNAKSTGRIGVVIGKPTAGGGHLQRTVMTRKEKDGWKVLDIEEMLNFKPIMSFSNGRKKKPGK